MLISSEFLDLLKLLSHFYCKAWRAKCLNFMRNDICVIRADIITVRTEKMRAQATLSYYNEATLSTKSSMLLIIIAGYYRMAHYDLYLYLYSCTFSNLSSFSSLKSLSKFSFWSFFLCFSSLPKQTLFLIMLTTAPNTQAPYVPKTLSWLLECTRIYRQ